MLLGIRVDGGPEVGLGHVFKSIWFAKALIEKGFKVIFLITDDQASKSLIDGENFETIIFPKSLTESQKINRLNQWVCEQNPKFLVIDHWSWPREIWSQLNRIGTTKYVGIDVPPEGISHFDIAFQGIRETLESNESTCFGCRVFNGVDYLIMSPKFKNFKAGWKPPAKLKKILLTHLIFYLILY